MYFIIFAKSSICSNVLQGQGKFCPNNPRPVFYFLSVNQGSIVIEPSADSLLLRFLDLSWPPEYEEIALPFPSICPSVCCPGFLLDR